MKRVFGFLMAAVMLVSITAGIDLSAYAKTESVGEEYSYSYVNPYYEGKIAEAAFSEDEDDESDEFTCKAPLVSATAYSDGKAIEVLRDKMVARTKSVTLNVVTPRSGNDALQYIAEQAISQERSVSTADGDYLRWNMYSMQGRGRVIKLGAKNEYQLTFEMEYLTTAAQEKEITNKINSVLKSLNLNGKSDFRKLKLIHDFVCENAKYDYDHLDDYNYKVQFSTYGALIKGVTVCQGYSTLFYRLCKEVGISCRVVAGGNHGWNIAKLGGKYYYIDTTWDDTQTDFYPEKENNSYWSDDYVYDWFMLGSEDFLYHTFSSEYTTNYFKSKYPVSTESYVCTHPSTVWVIPKDASCLVGFDKDKHCAECDAYIETVTVEPAESHTYVDKVVAPSCTAKGYTRHTCSVCNSSYDDKIVSATGHSYKKTVTKATEKADGKIVDACTKCKAVKSTTAVPKIKSVALSTTATYYNGKVKTPGVTVKDSKGKTLKKGTDYTVSFASGRKNVGRYAVTVTFKGNYSGKKTLYFNIIPRGVSKINSVTPRSKGFVVNWTKQRTQTTGYQIQYSTNKNMSGAKTITMPKNTYYAKNITGLKGNTRYYVRIRTYKVTKFNGKNYNIYSPWCATKYVTTKR